MRNDQYIRPGKFFFALALLAIGLIHLVTGNFPKGLMPVSDTFPARTLFVYVIGAGLTVSGLLIMINKYAYIGTILGGIVLLGILLFFHLPRLVLDLHNPGLWTPSAEIFALFSGSLILRGIVSPPKEKKTWGNGWQVTGNYLFALALLVFGFQHFIYAQFVSGIVPSWIPWPLFWVYFVMVAFFLTAISIFIQKMIRLSTTLLAFMFFFWIWTLHLPLAISDVKQETGWTSLFNAVAMCGICLLIAGSAVHKHEELAGEPVKELK